MLQPISIMHEEERAQRASRPSIRLLLIHGVLHREILICRRGTLRVEKSLHSVIAYGKARNRCLDVAHDKAAGTRLHTLVLAFSIRTVHFDTDSPIGSARLHLSRGACGDSANFETIQRTAGINRGERKLRKTRAETVSLYKYFFFLGKRERRRLMCFDRAAVVARESRGARESCRGNNQYCS